MHQVCGRNYTVMLPIIHHNKDRKKACNRIHVDGLTKADGSYIRFKSTDRAERHIRNMRLER